MIVSMTTETSVGGSATREYQRSRRYRVLVSALHSEIDGCRDDRFAWCIILYVPLIDVDM